MTKKERREMYHKADRFLQTFGDKMCMEKAWLIVGNKPHTINNLKYGAYEVGWVKLLAELSDLQK